MDDRLVADVGYVGGGFIGLSGALTFAREGKKAIVYDINEQHVRQLQNGHCMIDGLEEFLGITVKEQVSRGNLFATAKFSDVAKAKYVIVAVPTERAGEPDMTIVREVVSKISELCAPGATIVIESTLQPGEAENLTLIFAGAGRRIGEDVFFVIAPRRDWFGSPPQRIWEVPRVAGGWTEACTEKARRLYDGLCICWMTNAETAEMVKVVENAMLYVPVVAGFELAGMFSYLDMNEVLRLVGTHWRIPQYHLAAGVGGYCVNIAPKYLLKTWPSLEMMSRAVEAEALWRKVVTQEIVKQTTFEPGQDVIILGASYKPQYPILHASPVFDIVAALKKVGTRCAVIDPVVRISEMTKARLPPQWWEGRFPSKGKVRGLVLLTPHHRLIEEIDSWLSCLMKGGVFCDLWGDWDEGEPPPMPDGVRYWRLGGAGWRQ